MCDVFSNRSLLVMAIFIFTLYVVLVTYLAIKTKKKVDK
jgi:hypothetical protein